MESPTMSLDCTFKKAGARNPATQKTKNLHILTIPDNPSK